MVPKLSIATEAVDIDAISIGAIHGVTNDNPFAELIMVVVVFAAGSRLMPEPLPPRDRAAVVDRDRCIAGDAVARTIDQTAFIIVDDTARLALEINGVVAIRRAAAVLADNLAVVVDRGIDTSADRVGIGRLNQACCITRNDRMSIGR